MKPIYLSLLLAATAAADPAVLGRAGDLEITTRELNEELAGLGSPQADALSADSAALNQYVRALLIQRLVLKKAGEEQWDKKPEVIAKLAKAREAALVESFLESASQAEDGFPSAEEIEKVYEANKDQLVLPKAWRLAQIYVALPEGAATAEEKEAKQKLDAVVKQLGVRDADFAQIARESSEESSSAANGGEIGWLTEQQIQTEIRKQLPKLKLNDVSGPIRLPDGWHILKVLDIREARTPTLGEVRDNIVTKLRVERERAKREDFLAELLKANPVAVNEIELMKLGAKGQ